MYGDRHGVHADPRAEAVLYQVLKDVQPEIVINVGDDVDCYAISSFDRNPARAQTLQDEIDNTRAHLHQVSQIVPNADKYWLEGNHEDRLRRTIWRLPGAAAELAKLKVFQETMTWPTLVSTASIGWEFVSSAAQSRKSILPRLTTVHGSRVGAFSGFTAKLEMLRYGRSGMSGHTHRLGQVFHRDLNGSHTWIETGCLCSLDPDYVRDPDWQQGLAVVTYTPDDKWFNVELVYIENGQAQYRENKYQA